MIFAVLGVIILIVSFSIALYSLIREQNHLGEREEVVGEFKKPEISPSVESDEAVKKPDVIFSKRPRETYTWDQNLPKGAEKTSIIDEEKEIREIEARLAQIKSETSEGLLNTNKPQVQSEEVLPKGNLRGEFSIGDMLKNDT